MGSDLHNFHNFYIENMRKIEIIFLDGLKFDPESLIKC